MGMAALELTARGGNVDYQRLSIGQLRDRARQQHPEHTDEAARAFVEWILDMEVQRRTGYGDERLQGYGSVSPTALLGELPGGGSEAREPLAAMYDRGIRTHGHHEQARQVIASARLPQRQLLAVLIQARKLHGNGAQSGGGDDWVKSYDQIAANLGHYAQQLGWGSVEPIAGHSFDCIARDDATGMRTRTTHQVPAFKNGQAIKNAAKSARAALILLAKT